MEVTEIEPTERVDRAMHRVVSYEPANFDPSPVGTYIVTPPSSPEMMREHNRSSISNTSGHEAYPAERARVT